MYVESLAEMAGTLVLLLGKMFVVGVNVVVIGCIALIFYKKFFKEH